MRLAALAAALLLLGGGCGGDAIEPERTIEVEMVDTAFVPDAVQVRAGETIGFRFHNTGQQSHDAVIGTPREQVDREADIRSGGGFDYYDGHTALLVGPGETGQLVWTFDEPGTWQVGCHRPGHWDSGMVITVEATP